VLIGGGSGAVFAYLQLSQQQHASRDLLISNQVAKGFEQLGSDKDVVRLRGIYALEGVMNNSEQYHQPVLEALSAFVRDRTRNETGDGPPAADIQAALTVVGRRKAIGTGMPDFANSHIPKVFLVGADLERANLIGAHQYGANLHSANLTGANLTSADLERAFLVRANLNGARLDYAKLNDAELNGANLTGAHLILSKLRDAHLRGANLHSANMTGANLTSADLSGADLSTNLTGADLHYADLSGADLSGATVTQSQLEEACGTGVKLNAGLTLKPCPK
jgi:uncharacterized protein YjbI with pentapeptide repeats